jgi:hypothetical protein
MEARGISIDQKGWILCVSGKCVDAYNDPKICGETMETCTNGPCSYGHCVDSRPKTYKLTNRLKEPICKIWLVELAGDKPADLGTKTVRVAPGKSIALTIKHHAKLGLRIDGCGGKGNSGQILARLPDYGVELKRNELVLGASAPEGTQLIMFRPQPYCYQDTDVTDPCLVYESRLARDSCHAKTGWRVHSKTSTVCMKTSF